MADSALRRAAVVALGELGRSSDFGDRADAGRGRAGRQPPNEMTSSPSGGGDPGRLVVRARACPGGSSPGSADPPEPFSRGRVLPLGGRHRFSGNGAQRREPAARTDQHRVERTIMLDEKTVTFPCEVDEVSAP